MLDLEVLQRKELQQVYDWYGGQLTARHETFSEWRRRISARNWAHYRIENDGAFIGCLSVEVLDPITCAFHLAMQPGYGRLSDLRDLLLETAQVIYYGGHKNIYTEIANENRAARLLAALCGMKPNGSDFEYRRFKLTEDQFYGRRR